MMKKVLSFINFITKLSSEISGWLMLIIVILILCDIVLRNIDKPIQTIDSYVILVLIVAVYLGLANCEKLQDHVKVELFLSKMHPKVSLIFYLFDYLLEIITLLLVIFAATTGALDSFVNQEAFATSTTQIMTYPVRFIIVFGLILYCIQIFINFCKKLSENINLMKSKNID